MREIKFRAWDKDMREMIMVSGIQFDPHSPLEKPNIIDERNDIRDLDEIELMQYTGLKDKNGKEIYGGDILKSESWSKYGRQINPYLIVQWGKVGWIVEGYNGQMKVHPDLDVRTDYEIIGNIYKNPELLKS